MSSEFSEHETGPVLPSSQPVTSLEPAASVAQRLGRSVRTIERWVEAGILPRPIQIRGRNLHRAGVMPKPDAPHSKQPVAAAPPQEVTS